jgi:hypothetical protein
VRQLGRGGPGGDEYLAVHGGDACGRQNHIGIGKADQAGGRRLLPEQLESLARDNRRLGLTVDQDELDRPAEHAARLVGFVDGELGAARGGNVEVLLAAGEVVHGADDHRRLGGHAASGSAENCNQADC